MKSLTVAELREQLDQLRAPDDADVFYTPSMAVSTAAPIIGVTIYQTPGNPELVYLTSDSAVPNEGVVRSIRGVPRPEVPPKP